MKYRHLVMDDMDDAMLSLALRDAFPTIVFFPSGRPRFTPDLGVQPTIPECDRTMVSALVPKSGWEPESERDRNYPRWFNLRNAPRLHLRYARTRWFWDTPWSVARWSFDLPTPEFGTFGTNYDPDDPKERAFVNKVWNILKRLATNRKKSALASDRVVLMKDAGGDMVWAGHHVLEWCVAEPRRMIDGCARPCDDWAPPDTAWYRDLRARAESMFGPGFGDPLEPPETRPRPTIRRT